MFPNWKLLSLVYSWHLKVTFSSNVILIFHIIPWFARKKILFFNGHLLMLSHLLLARAHVPWKNFSTATWRSSWPSIGWSGLSLCERPRVVEDLSTAQCSLQRLWWLRDTARHSVIMHSRVVHEPGAVRIILYRRRNQPKKEVLTEGSRVERRRTHHLNCRIQLNLSLTFLCESMNYFICLRLLGIGFCYLNRNPD